ncbi:unnamed protein product [Arctia plantaginis]|uniref:Major facilitator superfamily (MFS) profile domain-containing protein n=1 Tax=Arctia plantaginis TaxID=874455 RepID=A0A8S1A8V3_ARCPL|nr:unnamed protein product [Arctia plantaginis]
MFLAKIPLYWHLMSLIFLSPPMEFQCDNLQQSIEKEHGGCPCDNPSWNRSVFTETAQTKFGLICDRAWVISFSESMLYVGTLIGSLVFGFMADKYGRLLMFSLCCLCVATAGCLVSVMPTAVSYIIMRCLEGIGTGGAIVTGFVYIIEYCGTRYRDIVAALYHIPLTIGHVTLAGVSYLLRNYNKLQLALSVPMFVVALSGLLIHESPKWLMDSGKIDKAAEVIKKIDKFNNTSTSDNIQIEMEQYRAALPKTARNKENFFQIFKYKKLLVNFLSMSAIYLICGMGYYGVSQYIGRMSGDIHCIFMLAVIFISPDMKITKMVLASCSNTCFFISFIVIFLYGVELFPTGVRNSVLGVLSVLSRIGMIIAPPVNSLHQTVAGTIFGVSAILGAVLCYPLPETKYVALPSTMDHSRALHRKSLRESLSLQNRQPSGAQ